MAAECGERAVAMVWEDLTPARVLSPGSFANALVTYMALGGSTNAAVHLIALARRAGIPLTLADMDAAGRATPVLADLFPSGEHLMEDFWFAGGLPGLLTRVAHQLDLGARTVSGRTLGENIAGAAVWNDDVIRPFDRPVTGDPATRGALAVLRGNLAPGGAVIKPSAASPQLLSHRGPALVFDDHAALSRDIDDPALPVTADTVLVLRNAGPGRRAGLPRVGQPADPEKAAGAGRRRPRARLSDARMSGTHYGTCVLHVAPEAAVGGPLALVEHRRPHRARRRGRAGCDLPSTTPSSRAGAPPGRRRRRATSARSRALYQQHVTQADEGCDFDFLATGTAAPIREPDIY